MATIKKMACTAKKSAKVISLTAATAVCMGAQYANDPAAQAALKDILTEEGQFHTKLAHVVYTWDPFDGFCA